jgi:signal transduction histidine kinase
VGAVPTYAGSMVSRVRSQIASEFATGVTAPPTPRPRWLKRGRIDLVFLADLAIALICFMATNELLGSESAKSGHHYGSAVLPLISFVLSAPLVLRTRLPLTAWASSAAAILLGATVIPPRTISTAPYLFTSVLVYGLCLYAVSVRCKAWVLISATVVTAVGAAFIDPQTAVPAVFLSAIPVLAGVIVRSRRSNREQLAVATRRHEGERALLEERQRIARELHDVVAHHMSVIAIQAEAAPYKTADPPKELVESFADIRASALSGLGELRRVLGVLRSEAPATAPAPSLDDLDGLLESARGGGVTVSCEVSGTPRPLTEGVDLSAYRIVQEALSNAVRHAPGSTVQVRLHNGEAALVIEVRNSDARAGARARTSEDDALRRGGGHGIIGMRERATMLGGHLSVGRTRNDEFLVTASLPFDGEDLEPPPAADDTHLEDAS